MAKNYYINGYNLNLQGSEMFRKRKCNDLDVTKTRLNFKLDNFHYFKTFLNINNVYVRRNAIFITDVNLITVH